MDYRNKVIFGDCLTGLKQVPDNTFDVAFTSPPYADFGVESSESIKMRGGDNPYRTHRKYLNVEQHVDDWLQWQIEIIDELLRTCKKWVIYNVGAIKTNRANVYKLIGHYADRIHDDIIWYKPNGLLCCNEGSISNTYEHILLIKKNVKDMIHVKSRLFRNVIDGIGVNSNNEFADIHHAVMNKKLSDLCINEFTDIHDLVVDPFIGVGTTALSCKHNNRYYCGFEICKQYYEICLERVENGFVQEEVNVNENSPLFE